MCTLSLSDIGELRDDWLRPAKPVAPLAVPAPRPQPAGRRFQPSPEQLSRLREDQALHATAVMP